jgi:hypothetical protein
MPDYSNGKIYTIRNREDNNKIYVGSTIQPLYKRLDSHKRDSKRENHKNMKLYIEVNNNWDNWYIELYENYSCNNREELYKKEGEIIRLIGTLNSRIEGRDMKQYCIDNKDKIKEYHIENADIIKEYKKKYHIKNADKLKEKSKIHYDNNKEKNKERDKQYRIENADKIKEYMKQYRLKKKLEKGCETAS